MFNAFSHGGSGQGTPRAPSCLHTGPASVRRPGPPDRSLSTPCSWPAAVRGQGLLGWGFLWSVGGVRQCGAGGPGCAWGRAARAGGVGLGWSYQGRRGGPGVELPGQAGMGSPSTIWSPLGRPCPPALAAWAIWGWEGLGCPQNLPQRGPHATGGPRGAAKGWPWPCPQALKEKGRAPMGGA